MSFQFILMCLFICIQEESPHQSQSSFFDREPDNDDGGLKKDEMFYEDFRDSGFFNFI